MTADELEKLWREKADADWKYYCEFCARRDRKGVPFGDGGFVWTGLLDRVEPYRHVYRMSLHYRQELKRLVAELKRVHYSVYTDWVSNPKEKFRPSDVIQKLGKVHYIRPYYRSIDRL
jgi:hypothetical protein